MTPKAVKELQQIVHRDYGASIEDAQAQELGTSLLRLTRLAIVAQARASKQSLSMPKNIKIIDE